MTASDDTDPFPSPDAKFAAARDFIRREGRLLEQRLFATIFEAAPADGVIAALAGFRNADGGFGHGLEPDKLCPDSLPIDVEIALRTMDAAGAIDPTVVHAACDYLASVSRDGAVALAAPIIESYPRAEHWSDWAYRPDINPTAGLTGLLYKLDVDHPWRANATAYCWQVLEGSRPAKHAVQPRRTLGPETGLPDEAHALGEALVFLEHVADRDRAAAVAAGVREHLPKVTMLRLDARDPGYGVTPLHYAANPASPWRGLFSDDTIAQHLDRLAADQEPDGGWALTWEPPSRAATLAYRGMVTLHALQVLAAYGRLTVPST
jgi:hypothetical protein